MRMPVPERASAFFFAMHCALDPRAWIPRESHTPCGNRNAQAPVENENSPVALTCYYGWGQSAAFAGLASGRVPVENAIEKSTKYYNCCSTSVLM